MQHELVLILAVLGVGVFHTLAPDHWVPIAVLARQSNWGRADTARVAAVAGTGHALSTLGIGIVVWLAGAALALRFGHAVEIAASLALVTFGGWIAVTSLRDPRLHDGARLENPGEPMRVVAELAEQRLSARSRARLSLLLIVGSSPMIEGLPAFFAASRFGFGLVATMSLVFAAATIVTYVVVCDQSAQALKRWSFGPLERYSEVISGAIIMAVGIASFFWF